MKMIRLLGMLLLAGLSSFAWAQKQPALGDSAQTRLMPTYDRVSGLHRKLFGENYRSEYASLTRLPVIDISKIGGGLVPLQRGGGNQTRSLRLRDAAGNEWTLRSIEKYPQVLLPSGLRETFLGEVIKDNMSAQHPFSALIVPVLASAIGAPHSRPVIGIVEANGSLGEFEKEFAGTVCLLEEREPLGKTDNTAKMHSKLQSDHNYTVDDALYLKLKCLDVLIGDWDRHDDQWRWKPVRSAEGTTYVPVPRDRDQVFYRSEGLVQRYAQSAWLLPMMQGYERGIQNINWFLWEGREINSRWLAQIDEKRWNGIVRDFCQVMTDALFEQALSMLPEPGRTRRHDGLLAQLRQRREKLPALMAEYYRFFNRIVDIQLSDRDESVSVTDAQNGGLWVTVAKSGPGIGVEKEVYRREFDPATTKEIRLYLHNGTDCVLLDNQGSSIMIRLIGGKGHKHLDVENARGRTHFYGIADNSFFMGSSLGRLTRRLSNDSANTAYLPKDMYHRYFVYPNLGFNNDDGLALGLGVKFTSPGFRKMPYGSAHSFAVLYSFGTSALKLSYSGEWLKSVGSADLVVHASAAAPTNTQNFFGLGNQSAYERSTHGISYYRSRFNLYELSPVLRWRASRATLTVGTNFQHYSYDAKQNTGRFISEPGLQRSSDSLTIDRTKMFVGAVLGYAFDSRDNELMPKTGIYMQTRITAHKGLNSYSNSFSQFAGSIAVHKKIGAEGELVLADRIGGGFTLGHPAFYQSMFLGGQGNLMGYRQFRFAAAHSLYNNLEARIRLGNVVSYVLPGQIGLLGLYDVGRVWKKEERSKVWHHGLGGGLYFASASLALFRFVASYSKEGWYPYFNANFRF